jgi:hypothetical protein
MGNAPKSDDPFNPKNLKWIDFNEFGATESALPSPTEAEIIPLLPQRNTRRRLETDFYYLPGPWARAAARAVRTPSQLLCAHEIYRRWRMRAQGERTIGISNAFCDDFVKRKTKIRTLTLLKEAGLIEIVSCRKGMAPTIRVVEKGWR